MATSRDDKKLTFRKFEDGDYKWDKWTDAIFEGDHSHKCPTYVHRTPPCQGSCPSGEDIRGWLDIVRGIEKPPQDITMQEYAFRRSTDANPFPAMMGRVCPAPCQDGCNRNDVEDFVGINAVEQYIGDAAFTATDDYLGRSANLRVRCQYHPDCHRRQQGRDHHHLLLPRRRPGTGRGFACCSRTGWDLLVYTRILVV